MRVRECTIGKRGWEEEWCGGGRCGDGEVGGRMEMYV